MAFEVIKGRQWATSEEVVSVLEKLLAQAKTGEIISLAYVAERPDESVQSAHTRMENVFTASGLMTKMAVQLLGFVDDGRRKPI